MILTAVLCGPRFHRYDLVPPSLHALRELSPRKSSQHDASRRVGFAACFCLRHDGARRLRRGRPPAAGSASSIGWSCQASLVAVARCRTGVVMRCMTHAQQLAPGCHVEPRLDRARGRVRGECHCESFGCLAACVLWLKCVEREMVSKEGSFLALSQSGADRPAPTDRRHTCDPITSGQADRRSEVHITGVGAIVITAPQHPRASNARHAQRHLLLPPPPTAPLCFP